MENQHGDADADCPNHWSEYKPGYQTYINPLAGRREAPSVLILAAGEQAMLRLVRACGEVMGPVYHLADQDHAAIRDEAARLEPGSPLLAMTRGRLLLTTVGEYRGCPFCGVFAPDGAAGWGDGACPVLAGPAPGSADLLSGPVLCALHVLIDDISGMSRQAAADAPLGYSIDLPASVRFAHGVQLVGVCAHRGRA